MPTAIPIVSAIAAVVGTGTAIYGAYEQNQANKSAQEAQQRAEAARQQAMNLDNQRKQLEALRNQQRARSIALAASTASGSQLGSGLQGGYGQIAGQTNTNLLGNNQSLLLGNQVFAANADLSAARMQEANAASISSIGTSIGGIGKFGISEYGNIKSMFRDFNIV